ncbi:MAG: MCE family protein [Rhodococcus sp. (in: high G+C Gram-positive bacteria)]|nr:MAG: MCE family protein [Rhodococcus sp. (in: high G+C Gram-positive bacteria)]
MHRPAAAAAILLTAGMLASGCQWRGLNSVDMPGTVGSGEDAYQVRIQMPNITSLQQNSRVRVADIDVGHVSGIALEDWHALVTVSVNGDVDLPENAIAKVGQTSLLGTLHIELAPPVDEPPVGKLENDDLIPLEHASLYPTTEQTLASVSTVLNGGGLAQLQDIDREFNAALSGNEVQVRNLVGNLDSFVTALNDQKQDIIAASEGLDRLASTVDEQSETLATALDSIPPALAVLNEEKENLSNAVLAVGNFADVANRTTSQSRDDLLANLHAIEPTLRRVADAGPAIVQSLGIVPTFPWPLDGVEKFIRGDAGNLTANADLTLGRLDNSLLQETPFDGSLYAIETALGRTIGRQPSPQTANPLTAPLGGTQGTGGN